MDQNHAEQLIVKETTLERLHLAFLGRLDFDSVPDLWQRCVDMQSKNLSQQLIIDASRVDYCDGAGVGLFIELRRLQLENDKEFVIQGLNDHIKQLMDIIIKEPLKPETEINQPTRIILTIGQYVFRSVKNMRDNMIYLGLLSAQLLDFICHPRKIRWPEFWRALEDVGPNALPIIILIGFLVGLITAFQSALPLERFGAQIYLINLVGLGLFREMGPLMTAVLLAGRTASAFAAEIGTMKINQEIDALTTMGLDPMKFLTVPRVLATMLMTPLLNIFLIFFGLVGCALVMRTMGFNFEIFMHQLRGALTLKDCLGGMVKAVVFGIVIAAVGCMHGLKTRIGSSAVGYSTTQAVVSSLIMLVIVDGFFAVVYYVLGI